jgi:DNA-binding MarR family transcriptional regulator
MLLTDRRSFTIKLTAEGRSVFTAMAQAHEAWIVEMLSPLGASQQEDLHHLLGILKSRKHNPTQEKT